ncbi:MAG: hypothetical protein ACFCU6_00580 [Balneolaceae bacterium]
MTNKINSSLNKKKINVSKFKTWEETKINATGLEIMIDLDGSSQYLDSLSINMDWDKFREAELAEQLSGTDGHPLLKSNQNENINIDPVIDIEVTWYFNIYKSQPSNSNGDANYRIEAASQWMDELSKKVNEILTRDEIITRWHIEVDGDENGRYLTAINLISYFQYPLSGIKSLNEVHEFVDRKLMHLLYIANRIIRIADSTIVVQAA